MIRKLMENDRKTTVDFLSEEPSINLFIIGDIEAFGFEKEFQELWGSFNDANVLEGVLLRFNENYIPYYKDSDFNISEFKRIICSNTEWKMISGKESIVSRFKDVLRNPNIKSTYFCELTNKDNLIKYDEKLISAATEEDAQAVYDLLADIEEFTSTDTNSVERIKRVIETKTGRIYFIADETNRLCNVTQTTAENSKSAMVVGVATRKDCRRKGYMSQCLSKLCDDVLSEGKTLCLFYDNPEAGKIYHKLGFVSIDKWLMLIEEK